MFESVKQFVKRAVDVPVETEVESPQKERRCYDDLESKDWLSEFDAREQAVFHLGMDYQFARTSLITYSIHPVAGYNFVEVYTPNCKRVEQLMTALGLQYETMPGSKTKHKIRYEIVTGSVS